MGPPLGFLPLHWNDRFSSSVQKPAYKSCHLYAGCRLDSKRVPSRLIPATLQPTGFDNIHPLFDTSSMVHSRSSLVCSPDMIFCHAFSLTLTTMTLYHSSLRWFGTYALTSIPRGLPSSFVQHELLPQFFLTHWSTAEQRSGEADCYTDIYSSSSLISAIYIKCLRSPIFKDLFP